MARRAWCCLGCRVELGVIGRDREGCDVLNLRDHATITEVDLTRAHTDVRCQCGRVKRWQDGRVVLPRTREAVPMAN